jgi:biotin carboxylase
MKRVLLFAATTGYQVRAFDEAARELDVSLQLVTDRCDQLDDPWRDRAIPVRFHQPAGAIAAVAAAARRAPVGGVLAVGDRPAVVAALAAEALGIAWHSSESAEISRSKRATRRRFRDHGLPTPEFGEVAGAHDLARWHARLPVVIKPAALSGSRGVIRADTPDGLRAAWDRLRALLARPDVRAMRDPEADVVLVETFIPGREYALEGLMTAGRLQTLAIFDKPDPLYGPFFEETIYITPSTATATVQAAIERAVDRACRALGLTHGPIHAECRVNERGVYVLEVAARPIGGICARALRFKAPNARTASLEALLIRHALGERTDMWTRVPEATGVMMIPIPRAGIYRGVAGEDRARAVDGIDDVVMTARLDQLLLPLPEGATYLGFIFARGRTPRDVEHALRTAHARLEVTMERPVPLVEGA